MTAREHGAAKTADLVGSIHALRDAFPTWHGMTPEQRGEVLDTFIDWHASDCPSAPLPEAARLWRVKVGLEVAP